MAPQPAAIPHAPSVQLMPHVPLAAQHLLVTLVIKKLATIVLNAHQMRHAMPTEILNVINLIIFLAVLATNAHHLV